MPRAQAPHQGQAATQDSHTSGSPPSAHAPASYHEQEEPSQFLLLATKSIDLLVVEREGKAHFKVLPAQRAGSHIMELQLPTPWKPTKLLCTLSATQAPGRGGRSNVVGHWWVSVLLSRCPQRWQILRVQAGTNQSAWLGTSGSFYQKLRAKLKEKACEL